MQALNQKLGIIRRNLADRQQKEKLLIKIVKRALGELVGQAVLERQLKDFILKNGRLTITTRSKSFASELFLKQPSLADKLKSHREIKTIVVR